MAVDQVVLARMILGAPSDLSAATASLNSINNSIIIVTQDDTLYKDIMAEAKTQLEARLATKLISLPITPAVSRPTWQATHTYLSGGVILPVTPNGYVYYTSGGGISAGIEPAWPLIPGNTVVDNAVTWECESLAVTYGTGYGVSNISAWEIRMQPADISIYQYQNTIADVKTYALGNFSDGNKTYRSIVSGFSQSLDWVRIGIQGHSTQFTTIVNVSIAERDGATQNIVPGTMEFFTFSGINRVTIDPGVVQYTDWLEYAFDSAKTYFITMFVESLYGTYSAGSLYYLSGDYSSVEDWGTAGASIGQTRSIKVIQGWLNGAGYGWDGDTLITQWVPDWSAAYPMVWNNPFGTYYMLAALNQGQPLISAKKTLITNRNPILAHYVTP